MKIGQKIISWFMLFTLLPWVIICSIVYITLVDYFETSTGKNLMANVMGVADSIDRFMIIRSEDLNAFSNSPIFELTRPKDISKHLRSIVDAYPFYDELIFADTDGIIIASSDTTTIGMDLFESQEDIKSEFIKTVAGGSEDVYISDVSDVSRKTEDDTSLDLEILSDVRNSRGETIGVLIGLVNISLITQLVFDMGVVPLLRRNSS